MGKNAFYKEAFQLDVQIKCLSCVQREDGKTALLRQIKFDQFEKHQEAERDRRLPWYVDMLIDQAPIDMQA